MKGKRFVTRSTRMESQSPITYGSTMVKFVCCRHTVRQTELIKSVCSQIFYSLDIKMTALCHRHM